MKWQKVTLLLLVLLFFTGNMKSEESNAQPRSVWFGFQAGFNASFFNSRVTSYGDPKSGYDTNARIGGLFGVKNRVVLSPLLAIHTELFVTGRGGAYQKENKEIIVMSADKNQKAYHVRNFRLTYLEMPVVLNVNLNRLFMPSSLRGQGNPDRSYMSASVGFSPSLNVASSFRYNVFEPDKKSSSYLVNVKTRFEDEEFDYAQTWIFNSIVEVGYNIPLSESQIASFNLRWTQSLTDVYAVESLKNHNMQTKMSTIGLVASILF